jgi:APA family basic amino acid/polyamine antiporter
MAGKEPVSSELSRELNLFHITMMGLGMMIGAGVFLGVGISLHVVGPGGVLLTFLLNGIIAMFTATAYAELSSAIPHAGGAYNYARIGFGRGPSWVEIRFLKEYHGNVQNRWLWSMLPQVFNPG